jgi:hypothetical protein
MSGEKRLEGKRVPVTHAGDYMGPPTVELFRARAAWPSRTDESGAAHSPRGFREVSQDLTSNQS